MNSRVVALFFCLMLAVFVFIVAIQQLLPALGPQSAEQNLVILGSDSSQTLTAASDKNSLKGPLEI